MPDSESFEVVVRIGQRLRLELAGVARPGVDVADRERASERSQDVVTEAPST